VPEVVKADVRQASSLEKGLEGAIAEVRRVDDRVALRSEDEATGLIEGAYSLPLY
jgi:hypothetical protein